MTSESIRLDELTKRVKTIEDNTDVFFLVTMSIVIYFMQCGFAFLECGAVRSKNTTNILIKNILDSFIGAVAYWTVGYAFAFGKSGNGFISWDHFASSWLDKEYENPTGDEPDGTLLAHWFFHFVFAATAATIVSGAVAERCDFIAYFAYSIVITGFVYPIASHWAWDEKGWLLVGLSFNDSNSNATYTLTYQDFAGSGVVHLLGGAAALAGAAVMGPRLGRFDGGNVNAIKGHSVPLAALGGFILIFGFFAFNGGSQASISQEGDGAAICQAMVNTIISAAFAALTALLIKRSGLVGENKWSILTTINGALTGMVAICAGCNSVYPWGAAIIGVIAGITFLVWSSLVLKCRVDDPLDAVAVHMGGGIWGLIAAPILRRPTDLPTQTGIVFNITSKWPWMALGWNVVGLVAILGWSLGCCLIMFGLLRLLKIHRVSEELETKGLDIPKHGEPAYPAEAYGHGWAIKDESVGKLTDMIRGFGNAAGVVSDKPDSMLRRRNSLKTMENPEYRAMYERQKRKYSTVENGQENPGFHEDMPDSENKDNSLNVDAVPVDMREITSL